MKVLEQLNGWQRLWLVFSTLTFLATSTFVLYEAGDYLIGDTYVLRAMESPECKYIYTLPRSVDPYSANPDQTPRYECVRLYEYLQRTAEPLSAAEFLKQLQQRKREFLLSGAKINFGIWLFVVLTIYAIGLTIAWVRKGFEKRRDEG